ncbi:winged helix-turn-helix domain-containing protein [Pantoea dispersa]|uniref:winged helix-turn-helix domain-containing protein n=1 Tax=Pantoea dispersa TaxID=59814 RepID=UPI0021AE9D77|nr:winged helix-turn-helix domain-containing protein [Pantoea dispersa]MCT6592914.1 winged helix-turn-helix domain-containing protein [Pantoea dispersa]
MSRKINLNGFLVFEPEKKRITGKGSPIIIGASASLCLELLIENVGQLVTHQQFYDYVWRRFGTEPASTSLYQNISALRRALNKAGLQDDIIRTMPRKGFLLSPQTTVSRENVSTSAAITGQPESIHATTPVANNLPPKSNRPITTTTPTEEKKVKRSGRKDFTDYFFLKFRHFESVVSVNPLLVITSLTFSFLGIIYFSASRTGENEGKTVFSYITDYSGCKIFSKTDALLGTEDILKKTDKLKLDCRTAPYVYLTVYKNADRLSYFSCQHPLNTSARANCRSFYYVKNFKNE